MRKRTIILLAAGAAFSVGLFGIYAQGWADILLCHFEGSGDRIEDARHKKQETINTMFKEAGLEYPPHSVFIRSFKLEGELELWVSENREKVFRKLNTYKICSRSGELGPKRMQGDLQVPEGVYRVNRFNPESRFHLSLGLDYPNLSDRILGDKRHPGGDIFIHGSCVTIGCIPIRNGPIEELYLISLDSKAKSGLSPEVNIFPCRMDKEYCKKELEKMGSEKDELKSFWQNLEGVYSYFEKWKKPPAVEVDEAGRYMVKDYLSQ